MMLKSNQMMQAEEMCQLLLHTHFFPTPFILLSVYPQRRVMWYHLVHLVKIENKKWEKRRYKASHNFSASSHQKKSENKKIVKNWGNSVSDSDTRGIHVWMDMAWPFFSNSVIADSSHVNVLKREKICFKLVVFQAAVCIKISSFS